MREVALPAQCEVAGEGALADSADAVEQQVWGGAFVPVAEVVANSRAPADEAARTIREVADPYLRDRAPGRWRERLPTVHAAQVVLPGIEDRYAPLEPGLRELHLAAGQGGRAVEFAAVGESGVQPLGPFGGRLVEHGAAHPDHMGRAGREECDGEGLERVGRAGRRGPTRGEHDARRPMLGRAQHVDQLVRRDGVGASVGLALEDQGRAPVLHVPVHGEVQAVVRVPVEPLSEGAECAVFRGVDLDSSAAPRLVQSLVEGVLLALEIEPRPLRVEVRRGCDEQEYPERRGLEWRHLRIGRPDPADQQEVGVVCEERKSLVRMIQQLPGQALDSAVVGLDDESDALVGLDGLGQLVLERGHPAGQTGHCGFPEVRADGYRGLLRGRLALLECAVELRGQTAKHLRIALGEVRSGHQFHGHG